MKSRQVKYLLSACILLFLFTPCSVVITYRCYISTVCLKSLSQRKHVLLSVHSIYIPFMHVKDHNSKALSYVR